MYEYSKLRSGGTYEFYSPVDDMIVEGVSLAQLIDGYYQLSVKGRDLVPQHAQTTDVPRRPGVWLDWVQDQAQEITVTFKLEVDSSEAFRHAYHKLNAFLRQNSDRSLSVRFKDEMPLEYQMIFLGADIPSETGFSYIGQLNFLVPDPYKKGPEVRITDGKIRLRNNLAVLPTSIRVRVAKLTDTVEIVNGALRIVLKGSYQSGKDIEVNFKDDYVDIRYNDQSVLHELALHSDLENFLIEDGDTITAVNATVTEVVWRERYL